jgi:plasmid stabilization system protein ParE
MPDEPVTNNGDGIEEYEVRLTEPAEQEVEQAYLFHLKLGVATADLWYAGLLAQVSRLSTFPFAYPIAPDANVLGGDVRQMLYGRGRGAYRILYRVIPAVEDDAALVRVLHVRHAAREYFTRR